MVLSKAEEQEISGSVENLERAADLVVGKTIDGQVNLQCYRIEIVMDRKHVRGEVEVSLNYYSIYK